MLDDCAVQAGSNRFEDPTCDRDRLDGALPGVQRGVGIGHHSPVVTEREGGAVPGRSPQSSEQPRMQGHSGLGSTRGSSRRPAEGTLDGQTLTPPQQVVSRATRREHDRSG